MKNVVRLKVRKELEGRENANIIKLKGSLISNGYTEIIHILDHDDKFYINSFDIKKGTSDEVHQYITAFISREHLQDSVSIIIS